MSDIATRDLVSSYLEMKNIDQCQDYVLRGRAYAGLSLEDLQSGFAKAFVEYVRSLERGSSNDVSQDFVSEFALRGIEPDWSAVSPELERLTALAGQAYSAMSDEDILEANAAIVGEYKSGIKKGN